MSKELDSTMADTNLATLTTIKTEPKDSASEAEDEEVSADTLLFICGVCNEKFSCYDTLQNHLILHSGEQSLTCEICNKTFMYVGELKLHILSHSFEKHFSGQLSKKYTGDKNLMQVDKDKESKSEENLTVKGDNSDGKIVEKTKEDNFGNTECISRQGNNSVYSTFPCKIKDLNKVNKIQKESGKFDKKCKEKSSNNTTDIVKGGNNSRYDRKIKKGQSSTKLSKFSKEKPKNQNDSLKFDVEINKLASTLKTEVTDDSFPLEDSVTGNDFTNVSACSGNTVLQKEGISLTGIVMEGEVTGLHETENQINRENLCGGLELGGKDTCSTFDQGAGHTISNIDSAVYSAIYLQSTIPSSNSDNDNSDKCKTPRKKNSCKSPKSKSPGKLFSCIYCVKTFITQVQLNRHTKAHTCEKKFVCDHSGCTMRFGTNSDLKKHKRTHTGEKPHQCHICNKRFTTKGSQNRHIRSCAPQVPGIRTYSCEYCSKAFTKRSQLKRHVRIHTGEKPFKCEFCGRSFCNSGDRKQHLRIHTGERPYKCDYCDKTFSSSSNRKQHIRIHTGYKPFICDFCGKAFRNTNEIKRHIKIHIGEKTYKCGVCDKRFSQQSNLQQHFRIHTGEKPYVCDFCEKAFSRKSHLNRHYKIHTREVMDAAKISFTDDGTGLGESPFPDCPQEGSSFMDADGSSDSESDSDLEDPSFTDSEPNDSFTNTKFLDLVDDSELQNSYADASDTKILTNSELPHPLDDRELQNSFKVSSINNENEHSPVI